MWVVWNGRCVKSEEGVIPAMDRGVLLGDGIFDTLLAVKGEASKGVKVVWGEAHYGRLVRHAGRIGIALPFSEEEWMGALVCLMEAEDTEKKDRSGSMEAEDTEKKDRSGSMEAADTGKKDRSGSTEAEDVGVERLEGWAIRTTVTRGVGPRGIRIPAQSVPNWWMTISPMVVGNVNAARVVCGAMRRNESAISSQIKALGFLDTVWSFEEARRLGYDDVLFCNHAGRVACCSTSNVFWVFADRIQTPPLWEGVMDGVTRAWVIETLRGWAIPCVEDSLLMPSVERVVAAFSTSSLVGVRPWVSLAWGDKEQVFDTAHPWVERLQKAWAQVVGVG